VSLRLAYLVSRFPVASETFVLRELNAVAAGPGVSVLLLSLFAPKRPFVHPQAEPWLVNPTRPSAWAALRALAWWTARRPLRVLGAVATVVRRSAGSPGVLLRSLATLPLAAAHASTLRANDIDHVHAHYAAYPALAAWFCKRLTGVSYSFTAHAYDIFTDQSTLAEKIRDASFVIAISNYNREFLHPYGGDRETPVHVVHCGIDSEAYPYRPRKIPESGPVRALCVAALQEKKGHVVLLDAMASGSGELQRLRLDLVGDGELRGELERRAAELGLAGRVTFHGALAEPEVRELLEAADLVVLPSVVATDGQMEGLPVALIEAVACGVPVVASRLSGIPELIRDGEAGLLATPGDAAALRAALERALGGEQRFDLEPGRRLVESEFEIRDSAERLVELFEREAAANGPRA
jgi:colanic acid/amylovoran biosynthesis glycosyltransferase